MAVSQPVNEAVKQIADTLQKKPRTLWGDAWRRFRKHKMAMFGAVTLIILVTTSIVGPLLWTVHRDALDFVNVMSSPYFSYPAENEPYCAEQAKLKAEMGEEFIFTHHFTNPLIQLDPLKTILVIAHRRNTYDKALIERVKSKLKLKDFVRSPVEFEFYTSQLYNEAK